MTETERIRAFRRTGKTKLLPVTTTATVAGSTIKLTGATDVRIYNASTSITFISSASTAALATAGAVIPTDATGTSVNTIAPGETLTLSPLPNAYIAVIGSATNGNIYITEGKGKM